MKKFADVIGHSGLDVEGDAKRKDIKETSMKAFLGKSKNPKSWLTSYPGLLANVSEFEGAAAGAGTVSVPNSAYPSVENRNELDAIPSDRAKAKRKQELEILSDRVATAYTKKALYWSAKGRQYKPCKRETASGEYECPKCGFVGLRKAIYKKVDGVGSVPLYGCPSCMFLIRRDDIID